MRSVFAFIRLFAFSMLAASAQAAEWPDLSRPPAREGGGSEDAALIIAVGDYMVLPDVHGAGDNARDWYKWLKDTRGVPSVKVLSDHAATREAILLEAQTAASRVDPGGTLWVLFIGHGAPSQDGQDGVLIGADAQLTPVGLYSRALPRRELLQALESGQQAHTVVLLDACFSGRAEGGAVLVDGLQNSLLSGSWRPQRSTVISAARGDQFAGPLPGAARPAFSYLLLGALRGWGDRDRDGTVTVEEALDYTSSALYEVVQGRPQEPELLGPGADLVLAHGREKAPDLTGFVVGGSAPTSTAVVDGGGLSVGSSGGSGDMADKLAQLELAQRQREALEAQQAEAARKERELLASLQADREEKLDAAEAVKQREASEMWSRMAPIVGKGGPEAKAAVELFVSEYGSAKVWVEDRTGRYERSVRAPEVSKAQAWLGSYRDTGDSGREDAGGGAVSAGRSGIEWVSISGESFEMARSEVTVGQYRACVDAGACTTKGLTKYDSCNWGKSGREDHPVTCVDWHQASVYAEWVGGRLPSSDEWEHAAKGGQSFEYAGSNTAGDVAWTSENSGGSTHAVCGKQRNGYGLCDMSGNVWEWTSTASGSHRVYRGGSYLSDPSYVRVASRASIDPPAEREYLGFRLVR